LGLYSKWQKCLLTAQAVKDRGYGEASAAEKPGLLQTVFSCIASAKPASSHAQSSATICVELSEVSSSAAASADPGNQAVALQPAVAACTQSHQGHANVQHEDDEDEYDYFDPLLFMKNLPPLERCIAQNRPTLLPKQTRRCKQKTLVLDLDETLVHSSMEPIPSPDFSFVVEFNNQHHSVHVRRRPNLDVFLQRAAELFEVVVFTASQKVYAEKLLNLMDPHRKLVRYRVYRDACVLVDGNYLKDLTVLGRDMRHTFIVDNSPQAFGFQVDNGIPIESWYDDVNDRELLNLLPFLESLANVDDVRPHIQQKFRLKEMITRCSL
jgi:CTD small phosphatase-like protein 2